MPLDLAAIKARLSNITTGKWCQGVYWFQGVYPDGDGEYLPDANIRCEGEEVARADSTDDAAFIAHAPADIAALVAEVERLLALVPAPPKPPPPGEVWRHSGTFDIDGTDFAVDLVWVGAHKLIAYYPSNNQHLRNRCGYSPHPVIWVDGAIYWEDGLIATEQEEDFCAEVVEALIRYILEHGNLPDDFGDLGLDTFGRDVGIEVSNG